MRELRFGGITVTLAAGSPDLLPTAVARLARVDAAAVRIEHRCLLCGGDDHGHPFATADGAGYSVSRSRCLGREAVAVAESGPVGVDIESIVRVGAHPVEDVLLHPAETRDLAGVVGPDRDRRLTELWVAKEALVKATGHGLSIDLREIRLEIRPETMGGSLEVSQAPAAIEVSDMIIDLFAVDDDDVIGAIARPGGAI